MSGLSGAIAIWQNRLHQVKASVGFRGQTYIPQFELAQGVFLVVR